MPGTAERPHGALPQLPHGPVQRPVRAEDRPGGVRPDRRGGARAPVGQEPRPGAGPQAEDAERLRGPGLRARGGAARPGRGHRGSEREPVRREDRRRRPGLRGARRGAGDAGSEGTATALPEPPEGAILVVLQVREGKLIGKEVFRIGEWGPEEESFSQFLTDHYAGVRTFPEEVLVDSPVDEESLSAYLRELAGRPVAVRMPQRGRHAEMIALARENAREELARAARSVEKDAALERLARRPRARASAPPHRGVRHRAPRGAGHRGVHGLLPRRPAGPEAVPDLQHPQPATAASTTSSRSARRWPAATRRC